MRQVVIPLFDDVQGLDVVGPHSVLAGASLALDHLGRSGPRYDLVLAAETTAPVRGEGGLVLVPDRRLDEVRRPDTVIVPGGTGARDADARAGLATWAASLVPRPRRVASVCTGAFVLAQAGLCDGRRVTTHWAYAGELARSHPAVVVEPDAIHLRDGRLWTSAGVTAGIDLTLAIVEEDHGAEVAQLVARHLVVPLRRPGGQSQFSAPIWAEPTEAAPVRDARDRIHADPAADHSLAALAEGVGLSERHLARRFRAEIGETPARYVERVRVEAARALLESEPDLGLHGVAARCGFASAEVLRRAFHRRLGLSPADYRRQHRLSA